MDFADLQAQVANCLGYASPGYVFGAVTVPASLVPVTLEESGVDGPQLTEGFRMTVAAAAFTGGVPKVGATCTGPSGRTYRVARPAVFREASNLVELIVERLGTVLP
jgi:hypothetical protein